MKKELDIIQAIQVTHSLADPDVKKREFRGLIEAINTYKLTEGLILTMYEDGLEEVQHENQVISIKIMSIWKWLLI